MSLGYSQSLPIDFDDANDNNFTGIDGSVFTADVDPSNASDDVGNIVGGTSQWSSQVKLVLDTYVDFTTSSKTISFRFYTTEAVVMNGLLQFGGEKDGGFAIEKTFATDGNIGWQTIMLDFATATNAFPNAGDPVEHGNYSEVALFTNFGDTGTSTYYFDDISGAVNGDAVPDDLMPTDAPTTPPARDAADVISIYGDAYGTEVGLNNVGWDGSSEYTEETHASNDVLRVDFQTFVGADLGAVQDATNMTHLHMDFWIADDFSAGQVFNPKLSNHTGGAGETDAALATVALPGDGSQNQTWVSVDLELTDSGSGGPWINQKNLGIDAREALTQFLLDPGGTISLAYVDNIYFYKEVTASVEDNQLANFRVYPNPSIDEWIVSSKANTIKVIALYDVLGKEVLNLSPNKSEVKINAINLKQGLYFAKVFTESGITSLKLVKE